MSDAPTLPGLALPRPRDIPQEAKERIARKLAAELLAAGLTDGPEAEVATDILRVARPYMDGFKIARELEDSCGWDCDMQTAELLDTYDGLHREALEAEERAWATANDIKPRLEPGTRVRAKVGRETREGVVRGVAEHAVARYLIRDAAEPESSTRAWIVAFEDVTELDVAVGAPAA